MPSQAAHKEKYKLNKRFLEKGINKEGNFEEWEIVVMFYCAVHIVECALAENNTHSKNHDERKNNIICLNCYDEFKKDYLMLEALSRKARYECFQLGKNDPYNAQTCLDTIENVNDFKKLIG